jgi:hypothetical protein
MVRAGGFLRSTCSFVLAASLAVAVVRAQGTAGDTSFTIRYKGLTLTPIGFVAAEAAFRSRNETADIATAFNAIPFTHTTNARLTEFRASARQSRFGVLAGGEVGTTKLAAYVDVDFLSAGTTSNSIESNSYTLRLRQVWAEADFADGLAFVGGQMWSLLTSNKDGIGPHLDDIPLTIDAQFNVGYDWARQWAVRVTQDFSNRVWLALAAEAPQMTFGGHGLPAQAFVGNPGGSQLNPTAVYSTDVAPDVIAKIAYEPPGFGHFEVKAIGRLFRDRVVDPSCTLSARCSFTATRAAGGVGVGFWGRFTHKTRDVLEIGLDGLWGAGIGRYGTSLLLDATARPDGTVVPVRAAHALLSIVAHPTRNLDIYAYAGTEYAYRAAFTTVTAGTATGVGYGSPLFSNAGCETELPVTGPFTPGVPGAGTNPPCTGDTRDLWECTLGLWYSFYRGSAGRVAWGLEYHYVSKNTWAGVGGQPQAIDNMAFTSFRYYLP